MAEPACGPRDSSTLTAVSPLTACPLAPLAELGQPLRPEPHGSPPLRAAKIARPALWLSLSAHLLGVALFYWLALHPGPVLAPPAGMRGDDLIRATLVTQPRRQPTMASEHSSTGTRLTTQARLPASPAVKPPAMLPKVPKRAKHPTQAAKAVTRQKQHRQTRVPPAELPTKPASGTAPASQSQAADPAVAIPHPGSTSTGQQARTMPANRATSTNLAARTNLVAAKSRAPTQQQETQPKIVTAHYRGRPSPVAYPMLARRQGLEGEAIIEVWLDEEGEQLQRVIIQSSGHALLDQAALRSVAQSLFSPYRENGQPQRSRLRLPIQFKLTRH